MTQIDRKLLVHGNEPLSLIVKFPWAKRIVVLRSCFVGSGEQTLRRLPDLWI